MSDLRDYLKYLNQYDVIYLDMTTVLGEIGKGDFISGVKRKIVDELQ